MSPKICVIIPAFNEEESIGLVIKDIPTIVSEVIVVNNNSTDATFQKAKDAGATVLTEKRKGYGYACLTGMEYISKLKEHPEIIVFLDGDYSDYPEELTKIIDPIIKKNIDLVIGSRNAALREKGSMTVTQIFGNWLSTSLMNLFYGSNFTDLGAFQGY